MVLGWGGLSFLTKQSSTLLSRAWLREGPRVWMALHHPCCKRAGVYWHQILINCACDVWGLVLFLADGERLELSSYQRWGGLTWRIPRHIDQSPWPPFSLRFLRGWSWITCLAWREWGKPSQETSMPICRALQLSQHYMRRFQGYDRVLRKVGLHWLFFWISREPITCPTGLSLELCRMREYVGVWSSQCWSIRELDLWDVDVLRVGCCRLYCGIILLEVYFWRWEDPRHISRRMLMILFCSFRAVTCLNYIRRLVVALSPSVVGSSSARIWFCSLGGCTAEMSCCFRFN